MQKIIVYPKANIYS